METIMTANNAARFGKDWQEDNPTKSSLDVKNAAVCICDEESRPMSTEETIIANILNLENHTSSVQPQETSETNKSFDSYRGRFMAGRESEYTATLEAYEAIYTRKYNSHGQALEDCRKFANFVREKVSGDVKVMSSSCRDRWCPMCAGEKKRFVTEAVEIYIKSLKAPRFLTLTLRNNTGDLQSQIEFLQECFRKIRYRAYWKKNVSGGIWFLQIKRGKNSGCWHPHLHMLLDGNYMEQARLSELWELVTYGSPIIDIRRVHDLESAAGEVARYVARPAAMAKMPLEDRIEVIEALAGKRLCGTFGNAKTIALSPPKIEDGSEWQNIGLYDQVVCEAQSKPAARAVLDAYHCYEPLSETAFENYTGHPVNVVMFEPPPKKPKQFLLDFYNR